MSKHSPKTDKEEIEYRYFVNVETGKLRFMNPKYKDSNITFACTHKLSESDRHKHGVYLR